MRSATRRGCSTMSQTIQSSGCCGCQLKPSARRCSTSPVSSTCWRSGPLSIDCTRRPCRVSTQVQPPGAAPRSAARMPSRNRRLRSSSSSRTSNASSSFSAEREGASACMRRRGMPSGHGALSAGSPTARKAWSPSAKQTCRRGRFGLSCGASRPALRKAGRSALPKLRASPASGLATSESGCSMTSCPKRGSPKRGCPCNVSSIGAMRSFGSRSRSSAIRRNFCRAKIRVDHGSARDSVSASSQANTT